ncbi:MAG: response regulator [Parachlamydiales bacterium]|jgi:polar amino acid transport system substrate-binding protein
MLQFKTNFNGAKVLVVEDFDINREIISEMLTMVGIIPDSAENGLEAVEKAKAVKYDLILMDIRMPYMDGYDATKEIRKLGDPQPIVIALTASIQEKDKKKSVEVGMDDYLSKPLEFQVLEKTLKNYLARFITT